MAPARTARRLTPAKVSAAALATLGLLGLGVVAAVVAVVVLALQLQDSSSDSQRREEVLQAARQQGINLTTLDHRSVDRDLERVLAGATGTFKKEFAAGAKDLTDLVVENKAVSTGEVLEAGLVTADSDSARVLVVVDSTVSNAATGEEQVRHYRMQLDLARRGQRWLTSDLTFVG